MRIGQNPAKSIDKVVQPAKVTITVVTYIPFLSGYYAESLEVLKVCLDSIQQSTGSRDPAAPAYDLMIFDNASCLEVRDYLLDAHHLGHIQYLILSDRNLGKGGAWNVIFQGAPGKIVAYSDSDVYFYPGWLEHSVEILEHYPNVGMVTARPLRTPRKFFTSTLEWAKQELDAQLETGQLTNWASFKEHTDSLGMPDDEAEERFRTMQDWRIHYQGLTSYAGAAHFQFLGYKETFRTMFPIEMSRPMGQVRGLDFRLNQQGYLRLTTEKLLVKHIGNRLAQGPGQPIPTKQTRNSSRKRLANLPIIRRPLLYLYNKIFRLYYDTNQ